MILVDVNLLVSATMTAADDHEAARLWFEKRLSGTARVGLPWVCLTGFLRAVAQPRAWQQPMPSDAAVRVVQSWLSRPCAWIPEPGPQHLTLFDELMREQLRARLVTDAHIAAIALEHGLELCSLDRDFARWSDQGLRSRNPLTQPTLR